MRKKFISGAKAYTINIFSLTCSTLIAKTFQGITALSSMFPKKIIVLGAGGRLLPHGKNW